MLSTFIFLWLHNQSFYKILQGSAIEPIISTKNNTFEWADMGCSSGLLTRLVAKLGFKVTGYDINTFSLFTAKLLSFNISNVNYEKSDFYTLEKKFDIISATSLLSVMYEDKERALKKLLSLLKNEKSTLIIIEPTEKMRKENVWKLIFDIKSFWFYKGLLVWTNAREGKAVSKNIIDDLDNINVKHKYFLNGMLRVSYIKKV